MTLIPKRIVRTACSLVFVLGTAYYALGFWSEARADSQPSTLTIQTTKHKVRAVASSPSNESSLRATSMIVASARSTSNQMARPPTTLGQQGGPNDPNNPLEWLELSYNPGKWLLDSVLGAVSGILLSITSVFQSIAIWAFGSSVAPDQASSAPLLRAASTASIAGEGIVFTTPTRFTTAPTGSLSASQTAHSIVMSATLAIMTLVFTFRCIRLIANHHRQAIIDLAFAFVGGMVMTLASWSICDLLIKAANVISYAIGQNYTFWDGSMLFPFADVTSSVTGLYLTTTLVGLCYWGLMVVLVFKAIGRIALVNLLIIISPVAGLGIMSGGWNYAAIWFFRMIELLVTPIAWLIVIGFLRNLLLAFNWSSPLIPYALGCYVLYITPKAPEILGLAAREAWNKHGAALTALATRAVMTLT